MGAVAPARYLSVQIDLYRNGTYIGAGYLQGLLWPGSNSVDLQVPSDPVGLYRLMLDPASPPEDDREYDGWTFAQATLEINGGGLLGPRKPLSWYTAEPTDWPSGIVRWHFPAVPGGAVRAQPVVPVPPVTYSVLIRRAN